MTTELRTNIKGLPEGRTYWTEHGYSQSYPWVEVKRTAKTVTLARVPVERDPDWQPEIIPGGFAGHCTNQQHQTWLFGAIDNDVIKVIRATKRGWMNGSIHYTENMARYFYDYNF